MAVIIVKIIGKRQVRSRRKSSLTLGLSEAESLLWSKMRGRLALGSHVQGNRTICCLPHLQNVGERKLGLRTVSPEF